ncbi:MAG TPA: hypothetical protein VLM37_01875 [Fibrobacteraceae bacterium]|nr:hypothetical protein [Fibrobacteraceae bacterium]
MGIARGTSFFFTCALFLAVQAPAQDLQIQAAVNPSQIHIGDRFQYHIDVTSPDSVGVDLPGLVGNLGSFEVKDLKVGDCKATAGHKCRSWDLTLSTFVGGDFLLPPQIVEGLRGKDTLRSHTEPVQIRVLSRVQDSDEDVIEVEGPVKDPHLPWWLWGAVGVVGVVGLFFLGRWLWKRLKAAATPPALPPYEEALRDLADLRSKGFIQAGAQAEHFFLLGQILRRYLHRQYQADVVDATTTELADRVAGISVLQGGLDQQWLDFCRNTDMVKFAKADLLDEDCRRLESFADEFLAKTRPAPEISNSNNSPSAASTAAPASAPKEGV